MKRLILISFAILITCTSMYAGQDRKQKLRKISKHTESVHITDGWIRDPYIVLGQNNAYYLIGTVPREGDSRESNDRNNTGLGEGSIVGGQLRLWKSDNLVDWEYLGIKYNVKDSPNHSSDKRRNLLWAPELHWMDSTWIMVHCPSNSSTLAFNSDLELNAEWKFPQHDLFKRKHDPSLFIDDDGQVYLIHGYHETLIQPIKDDFSGFKSAYVKIAPADRVIGHEGMTIMKIEGKYVFFGTAWSTDQGRKGSYNLYYCTSDNIYGPYSERRFVGRFLGHGTPFIDKNGNWWCTAFYNANVPTLPKKGIENRDLGEDAQTINPVGTTIVPLEVKVMDDGDIYIRAIDRYYRNPGPDEVQKFQ